MGVAPGTWPHWKPPRCAGGPSGVLAPRARVVACSDPCHAGRFDGRVVLRHDCEAIRAQVSAAASN
ncbi:hypothetical protein [Stenotrophomonas acidaminiphila]|uniref:hypothetical protein n=1 Tax=Stenotrophomonas acidaminiphila TaxID=128780 RepID=UPI0020C6D076|nr:hypothetical protein [Stenotrophomonas acidaminiphila]